MPEPARLEELWNIVRSIPRGCVASYGSVGTALTRPVSGFIVGRWMAQCPDDVPWWRVVGADGGYPLAKRDAALGVMQKQKLEQEGIEFEDGLVSPSCFFVP